MPDLQQLKQQFPVGLDVNWVDASLAPEQQPLRDWLLDPMSLTARLKRHSNDFRVLLLGQVIQPCPAHEAISGNHTNNGISEGEEVLVREVLLYCDGIPVVFARSLLPTNSLTGEQKALAELGEQPLGQVLFNNPKLSREILQVAKIAPSLRVCELAHMANVDVNHPLWGRRSLFHIEDKPLMVAEVFLPESLAYREKKL
ncbi:chorismate lyase [Thalassotalea mangrovi]|uniref:Probable chorismate pyruvate-lyase n=2 Tax=Thalassotalea mangrovi TaxID=2572245 RepID=A0A4U1B544_9GAMM|nr:chorismate lyase [Thalassotalea mangrovi]